MRDILVIAFLVKWLADWLTDGLTVEKNSYKRTMKPGTPVLHSVRLLDPLRERIRYLDYSLSTEKAYVDWVRFFIRWHGRGGVMRHPRDMGAAEAEAFLTMLATERHVSASTHNQGSAPCYFYSAKCWG
ncbi:hypothetical protein GALL_469490 [mine drainage metagenome]|uniref:Integrase SAM-like N-terminal domain-containing protein n=1 Tax=mine drainage metagenome TaxID=410659 RepID=A0A1J5Q1T0_9ZZZZ